MLMLHNVRRRRGRTPRFLVHPGLLRFWPVAAIIRRIGGVLARRENAETILERGGVLGFFPEGVRGPFRLHRDAYRVGRFLTSDFVVWAKRSGATIVPYVTVGPAEAFPILGRLDWRWWRRFTLWPFLPLTPLFPWLPLPIPLPSKWHTQLLEPIPPEELSCEGARAIARELRQRLQQELLSLHSRRPSIYYGALRDPAR